eukprot:7340700-Alexandrium_andersonii.AAC.1
MILNENVDVVVCRVRWWLGMVVVCSDGIRMRMLIALCGLPGVGKVDFSGCGVAVQEYKVEGAWCGILGV